MGVFPSAWDGHSPLTVWNFNIYALLYAGGGHHHCTRLVPGVGGWGVSERETLEDKDTGLGDVETQEGLPATPR